MNIKSKLILIIIFFFLSISSPVFSNDSIGYVDMELIMNESIVGKSVTSKLKKENDLNINFFKKREKELQDKEKKLISQQNILEPSELENQLKSLQVEVNEYRKDKRKKINDLSEKKINATKKLLEKINPILSEYADKNSISILMQKKDIVIGKTSLDKTKDILKLVDKNIKKIDF
tara:strand:- start:471 stop:998 length:528 start_codon:yes stop_codon:yes gene_type:complete